MTHKGIRVSTYFKDIGHQMQNYMTLLQFVSSLLLIVNTTTSERKSSTAKNSNLLNLCLLSYEVPLRHDHNLQTLTGPQSWTVTETMKRLSFCYICWNKVFILINSLRSFDNRYLGVTLMKNDQYKVAVYTDSSERNVMESQSVLMHLEVGDVVWLRLAPSPKFGLYSDQYHYTTFSGILVYKGN